MPSRSTATAEEAPTWLVELLTAQSQQMQMLQQLVTHLVDQKDATTRHPTTPTSTAIPNDPYSDLIRDLPVSNYNADDETTFDAWYKRYGPVIEDRGAALSEERKRNLLVDKLDRATYKTYSEHVLPLSPKDMDLPETIRNVTKLFGPKKTLIRPRYEFLQSMCPQLTNTYVPYRDFGNAIKKKFEDAVMKEVDSDSLKCLVFIAGLTDPSHSEMRLRLLNRLNRIGEAEPSSALDEFINECETFVTLRYDNYTMDHKEVIAAQRRRPMKKKRHPVPKVFPRLRFYDDLLDEFAHFERALRLVHRLAQEEMCGLSDKVIDDDSKLAISLKVPEFKPEELKVSLDGRTLTIEGKQEVKEEGAYSMRDEWNTLTAALHHRALAMTVGALLTRRKCLGISDIGREMEA
ncbi:hypothetical protein ANCCAN_15453 [Ancylostoma caninum]|uniref:SHSP domain-containing protein n=1 Tax=Ancylostoma caninum TaxID=29170 RepID=A0A368G2D4_ANCCA|nr:hypothetical protein ANCCAN_15453 [Ancylostoma caninum]